MRELGGVSTLLRSRRIRRARRRDIPPRLVVLSRFGPGGLLDKSCILNTLFDPITLQETVEFAEQLIRDGERGYVSTVNVAVLMMARSRPRLRRFIEAASLVVADGQPLVWVSRLFSTPLPERVAGVTIVDALCQLAEQKNLGVYFLGSRQDVLNELGRRLRHRHPGLDIRGLADGYFRPEDAPDRAAAIRRSRAEILFVGMGVPQQEYFLQEHWAALGANVAVGVGGSFEVTAGLRKRAPQVIQRAGLEWFFRLLQEPRRLWKRYLLTNSQFMYHFFKELLFRWARGASRPNR